MDGKCRCFFICSGSCCDFIIFAYSPNQATLGMVEYPSAADHEQLMKRIRPAQTVEEVTYPTLRQQSSSWSPDDLPRTVAFSLHQGSTVTTMDFHPTHQTLLLVGSHNGDISLWEVGV